VLHQNTTSPLLSLSVLRLADRRPGSTPLPNWSSSAPVGLAMPRESGKRGRDGLQTMTKSGLTIWDDPYFSRRYSPSRIVFCFLPLTAAFLSRLPSSCCLDVVHALGMQRCILPSRLPTSAFGSPVAGTRQFFARSLGVLVADIGTPQN
jgi:hypothetical protein